MSSSTQPIVHASWVDHHHGILFLHRNWDHRTGLPPIRLGPGDEELADLYPAPLETFGKLAGYFIRDQRVTFFLWPPHYPNFDWEDKRFYVAGDFNGWNEAIGTETWRLARNHHEGKACFRLTVPLRSVIRQRRGSIRFKFVTADQQWLQVPQDAPNRVIDGDNANLCLDPEQGGDHVFLFRPKLRHPILGHPYLVWGEGRDASTQPIAYGHLLADLHSKHRLGALVEEGATVFRLFAPRATAVRVVIDRDPKMASPKVMEMTRIDEAVWEKVYSESLHGWYYHFRVDGDNLDETTHFDPAFPVLDPYALACVSGSGPGIVIDQQQLPRTKVPFQPPAWHDLVILETHLRDLINRAPIDLSEAERRGFAGVTRWLQTDPCYLTELGVNAIELQPIQENDAPTPGDYHWGYMTCNFFSPASQFATDPAKASQIQEFKKMVEAFHQRGLAVILDVVYNHVGEPAHLLFVDKEYYFELSPEDHLMNYSGCGNDLRASNPMTSRLIIDSLTHLIRTFDVDGFRFDLAELLGVEVLRKIEVALKEVKPSVILIAEPWSFRGHIGQALRHTGWSSWNDGYRNFAREYVMERGNRDSLRYFISGSPHFFAMFPAQTVNYTESHDDHCWLDQITEREGHDGRNPTLNDRRRTHLMVALLMSSIGIPMLAQGQDFLRSKHGVSNTYQRGDINALDYQRLNQFSGTHRYVSQWIHFRRSTRGQLLRLEHRPSAHYLRFFEWGDTSAIGVLYNADHSQGQEQILFAINPHQTSVELPLPKLPQARFKQLADHETFDPEGLPFPTLGWPNHRLTLPPLSCGLWISSE